MLSYWGGTISTGDPANLPRLRRRLEMPLGRDVRVLHDRVGDLPNARDLLPRLQELDDFLELLRIWLLVWIRG